MSSTLTRDELVRQLLAVHEQNRLFVYDDATGRPIVPGTLVKGHPTIGYGRALDIRGITNVTSNQMRTEDIDNATFGLTHRVQVFQSLDVVRQAALIDLAHNVGITGVAGFHRMLAALEAKDYAEAGRQLLDSTIVKSRAEDLAGMLVSGLPPSWVTS